MLNSLKINEHKQARKLPASRISEIEVSVIQPAEAAIYSGTVLEMNKKLEVLQAYRSAACAGRQTSPDCRWRVCI